MAATITGPAPTRSSATGVTAVQAVGRRPSDIERRPWESASIFAFFTLGYAAVGYWLVVHAHVVGFETLERLERALMVLHDDPAKLSAVGFDQPPLSVLFLTPFTLLTAPVRSLAVVGLTSAVFAGLTLMFLHTMMRRAQLVLPLRLVLLAAVALNPLVVLQASLGAATFLWLAFVVAALGALLAWYVTADIRFVMLAGVSYSVAALTGYGSLLWFLASLVMVAAVLARLGADGREVEGTTVGFAAPTVYVVVLWTALNLLILTDPFHWITSRADAASGTLDGLGASTIALATGDLVLHGAPLAIVVLPALVFAGIARRNTFALWLGLMLAVSIAAPGLAALLRLSDAPLQLSDALPVLLVAVIGAIWLARSSTTHRTATGAALAAGLLLSIPWTFAAMDDFPRQGLERAFHDAVATGDDQEGARTLDGAVVGYAHERDMADFIRANVEGSATVLTDNAATYAVVLLTGSPATFVDRVDDADESWERIARSPAARVDYLLLSRDTDRDLLSAMYPAAAVGQDPALTVLHANDRYTLVEVPVGYGFGGAAASAPTLSEPDAGPQVEGGYDGIEGERGTTP